MMTFGFNADDWKKIDSPRRYVYEVLSIDITLMAGAVSVWEKGDGQMKQADVDVTFQGKHVIKIESSHKFDGEVRVTF